MWRNCPSSSASALSGGIKWHQWPNCRLSLRGGHHCNIFRPDDVYRGSGGELPQVAGQIAFGHLTSTWVIGALPQDSPCWGGFQRKTVFAQERSANIESKVLAPKKLKFSVGPSHPRWPSTILGTIRGCSVWKAVVDKLGEKRLDEKRGNIRIKIIKATL